MKLQNVTTMRRVAGTLYGLFAALQMISLRGVLEISITNMQASQLVEFLALLAAGVVAAHLWSGEGPAGEALLKKTMVWEALYFLFSLLLFGANIAPINYSLASFFSAVTPDNRLWPFVIVALRLVLLILATFFIMNSNEEWAADDEDDEDDEDLEDEDAEGDDEDDGDEE